jgi:hypothetical protein
MLMQVRAAQMAVLAEQLRDRFKQRMRLVLPQRHRTLMLDDLQWSELIDDGMARAFAYRIDAPADVERYLDYLCRFGRDFERTREHEWMHDILTDETVPPGQKMAWIDGNLPGGR